MEIGTRKSRGRRQEGRNCSWRGEPPRGIFTSCLPRCWLALREELVRPGPRPGGSWGSWGAAGMGNIFIREGSIIGNVPRGEKLRCAGRFMVGVSMVGNRRSGRTCMAGEPSWRRETPVREPSLGGEPSSGGTLMVGATSVTGDNSLWGCLRPGETVSCPVCWENSRSWGEPPPGRNLPRGGPSATEELPSWENLPRGGPPWVTPSFW